MLLYLSRVYLTQEFSLLIHKNLKRYSPALLMNTVESEQGVLSTPQFQLSTLKHSLSTLTLTFNVETQQHFKRHF